MLDDLKRLNIAWANHVLQVYCYQADFLLFLQGAFNMMSCANLRTGCLNYDLVINFTCMCHYTGIYASEA